VIAAWMLYALLVSVLVAAGAWLMEEVVRQRGGPVRFVWLAALIATVALVALAPLRTAPPAALPAPTVSAAQLADGAAEPRRDGAAAAAARALQAVRTTLARPLRAAAALGTGPAGRALAVGWLALSAAALALAAATALRARHARRGWPAREVAGQAVRVSPRAGPAVLGILHPEVVVPAWLLDASEEEQRLVVLHEREHVRARDPLVLAVGCVAAALVPWSPAAWWMLLRLRAAVELDCDARVLRRGVGRRAYGSLLIDMAGRGPGVSLGAPALAGSPSTLERRIRAMNARLPRFARLRAGALTVLSFALVAAACDTPLPTTAEVEKMDVRALEARTVALQPAAGEVTYFVDDVQVTAEQAHALVAERIARMDVVRGEHQGPNVVRIYTKAEGEGAGHADADGTTRVLVNEMRPAGSADAHPGRELHVSSGARFEGLVVIDGRISDPSAMHALDPNGIQQIDVIKGASAAAMYDDPRAANGVIRIVTKPASP
jgi:beta-lactamase regulating signal transducer with metallopeptidase domain